MITLESGQRVRLTASPTGIVLQSNTGTVVYPDTWEDHYIILLDEPAIECHLYGGNRFIPKIRVDIDNLEVVENQNKSV